MTAADRHYRVLPAATGGAGIWAAPTPSARLLGVLQPGDDWEGLPEAGQRLYVQGFGGGDQWIASLDRRFVWANVLELVREKEPR